MNPRTAQNLLQPSAFQLLDEIPTTLKVPNTVAFGLLSEHDL